MLRRAFQLRGVDAFDFTKPDSGHILETLGMLPPPPYRTSTVRGDCLGNDSTATLRSGYRIACESVQSLEQRTGTTRI